MPERVVTFSLSEDMCRYKKHMLKMVPVEKKMALPSSVVLERSELLAEIREVILCLIFCGF